MSIGDVFRIGVEHGYIIQILVAELLFVNILSKRPRFCLRLLVGILSYIVLSVVTTNIILYFVKGFTSLIIFLFSFLLFCFCFADSVKDLLFCCVSAQLIQNLSYNLESIIRLAFLEDITDIGWFFLSVGVMAIVYALFYYIIVRRLKLQNGIGGNLVFLSAVVTAVFCYLMQFLFQVYEIDGIWVTRMPFMFCCVLMLGMQYGLLIYKRRSDEKAELEYFIAQGNKQYETLKNSIDIINMKAHDLKHFVADIRANGYRDSTETEEILSSVSMYEQSANTGNVTLNVILTEKSLQCRKNNIGFSVMAQGEELGKIKACDIATIFGNALDNAIEYEKTVEEGKRSILLKVYKKNRLISIHVENYCSTEINYDGDLPKTTKGDSAFHGYGLKSIRYTAQKYGGNMVVGKEGEFFCLDVLIPTDD